MDLSAVQAALSDKSYTAVASLCDELLLQAASKGTNTDEWPYSVHLLAHLYINDLARFFWKSLPQEVKDTRPELAAVWRIESYRQRIFKLLTSAYSTISVADVAHFMGMSEEDATNYAVQIGWSLGAATKMLTVKKPKAQINQKLDASKLQRLTECVFHLEH
uniref:CSN8/PSMD8/EIF3K domain-containing protein n=1 Tax=Zea mays TaxID=4577 RepID=A0A804RF00_MAIZE